MPHFFSSLFYMDMNIMTDYNHFPIPLRDVEIIHFHIKFGEKLGRNWEEKI